MSKGWMDPAVFVYGGDGQYRWQVRVIEEDVIGIQYQEMRSSDFLWENQDSRFDVTIDDAQAMADALYHMIESIKWASK